MNVVLGQALRWWVKPIAQLDDVVRVIDAGERLLLVIAAGYATGFDSCWAAGSRLLLDLFADRWEVYSDVPSAFVDTCSSFPALAAELVEPEEDMGGPAASLMVADLGPADVTITWIGEHRGVILREGEQLVVAPSHTLGTLLAAQGLGPELGPQSHVKTRVIGIPPAEPETSRAALQPGDTLALLGGGAAARLDADLSGRNAEAIVERAMSDRERRPSNAVALLAYIG